jgi:hypothetical protein
MPNSAPVRAMSSSTAARLGVRRRDGLLDAASTCIFSFKHRAWWTKGRGCG